jgi:hypothetical protein
MEYNYTEDYNKLLERFKPFHENQDKIKFIQEKFNDLVNEFKYQESYSKQDFLFCKRNHIDPPFIENNKNLPECYLKAIDYLKKIIDKNFDNEMKKYNEEKNKSEKEFNDKMTRILNLTDEDTILEFCNFAYEFEKGFVSRYYLLNCGISLLWLELMKKIWIKYIQLKLNKRPFKQLNHFRPLPSDYRISDLFEVSIIETIKDFNFSVSEYKKEEKIRSENELIRKAQLIQARQTLEQVNNTEEIKKENTVLKEELNQLKEENKQIKNEIHNMMEIISQFDNFKNVMKYPELLKMFE